MAVDGRLVYSGTATRFSGGGIRLASLSASAVTAMGAGNQLTVITEGSSTRSLSLAGAGEAINIVRQCLADIFMAEQRPLHAAGRTPLYRVQTGAVDGAINLRSAPSLRGPVLTAIPAREGLLSALGECSASLDDDSSSTWCRFTWRGMTGWASMRVLERDASTVSVTPPSPNVETQPPSPLPTPTEALSTGTAFFITDQGHLLTNAHVVENCPQISIRQPGKQPITARVSSRDKLNDLALLQIRPEDAVGIQPATLRRQQVQLGEDIAVFGFPLQSLVASSGNFTRGSVTALAGLGDNTSLFQISAAVQSGNSGGPVLDQYGNVTGVVVSKLNSLRVAATTGSIPEQIGFAIKGGTAASFLEANGIVFAEAPWAKSIKELQRLEPTEVAERATAISAQVACRS
ncbi:trypsin-like peptidase domain-containing protein [Leptospira interrogans]